MGDRPKKEEELAAEEVTRYAGYAHLFLNPSCSLCLLRSLSLMRLLHSACSLRSLRSFDFYACYPQYACFAQ